MLVCVVCKRQRCHISTFLRQRQTYPPQIPRTTKKRTLTRRTPFGQSVHDSSIPSWTARVPSWYQVVVHRWPEAMPRSTFSAGRNGYAPDAHKGFPRGLPLPKFPALILWGSHSPETAGLGGCCYKPPAIAGALGSGSPPTPGGLGPAAPRKL